METNRSLFVSIPMTGRPDDEVWREMLQYRDALEYVLQEEFHLLDNFHKKPNMTRMEMLGDSIMLMAKADLILFAKGFHSSPGCFIECEVAMKYKHEAIVDAQTRHEVFKFLGLNDDLRPQGGDL